MCFSDVMAPRNKSYTPPKGRPTSGRDEDGGRSRRIPPMFEWIVLGLVIVAIVVAAWIYSSGSDGGSPHGAPAESVVVEVVPNTIG